MKKLINNMIIQMKHLGYPPSYCLISCKTINISKYPEITKMIVEERFPKDHIYITTLK